jgi:hypothetical protein
MSTDNRFNNMNTTPLPTNNRWTEVSPTTNSSNREGNASNRFSSNREGNASNRFSSNREGNASNRFSSNREGNSSNRFSSNREGNSSNRFPKPTNDRWKREDTKEAPFRNSFKSRRPRAPRQSHFKRYDSPPPKPTFSYKEGDFPSLSTINTKITDDTQQLNFKNAAEKGEKCVTPPPRPPLSPPARLSRPRKKDDDERSRGWDTDDEKAAREADPSDDEDEENEENEENEEDDELFW